MVTPLDLKKKKKCCHPRHSSSASDFTDAQAVTGDKFCRYMSKGSVFISCRSGFCWSVVWAVDHCAMRHVIAQYQQSFRGIVQLPGLWKPDQPSPRPRQNAPRNWWRRKRSEKQRLWRHRWHKSQVRLKVDRESIGVEEIRKGEKEKKVKKFGWGLGMVKRKVN